MKKIFVTALMSAIMILSAINPAAYSGTPYGGTAPIVGTSGVLKIEAEDYDEGGEGVAYHSTRTTKANSYRTDEYVAIANLTGARGVSLTTGEWLCYTVRAEKNGTYMMKLGAVTLSKDVSINVYVNDVKAVSGKTMTAINPSGNYVSQINDIGETELAEGINVIKIENPGRFFYPDYFTLEKVVSNEPFKEHIADDGLVVEAEDFDLGGQNVSYFVYNTEPSELYRCDEYVKIIEADGEYFIRLDEGEWAEYTIISDEESNYVLNVETDGESGYEVYCGDALRHRKEASAENASCLVNLKEGKNIIKLKSLYADTKINRFTLSGAEETLPYKERSFKGERLVIEAEDFDIGKSGEAWYDTTVGGNDIYRYDSDVDIIENDGGFGVDMVQSEWMQYTFDSEVSGRYALFLCAKPSKGNAEMTTYNNGECFGKNVVFFGENGYKPQYMGDIEVAEGINRFVLENSGSVGVCADYLILKQNEGEPFAEIKVPGQILPYQYDIGGMYDETNNSNGGYYSPFRYANGLGANAVRPYDYIHINMSGNYLSSFQPKDWFKYTVTAEKGGKYAMFMRGQLSAGTGKMDVYVNDVKAVSERIIPKTNAVADTFIGVIELNEGKNVVKPVCSGTSGYFFTHLIISEITASELKSVTAYSANNSWKLENGTVTDRDLTYITAELTNAVEEAENCAVLKGADGNIPLQCETEDGKIKINLGGTLEYNSEYTLEIDGEKITDLYNNKLGEKIVISFATGGREFEIEKLEQKGTAAEAVLRNNSYTDKKEGLLIYAAYDSEGMSEAAADYKEIPIRESAKLSAELKNTIGAENETKAYIWNNLRRINPITESGEAKTAVLNVPYVNYDKNVICISGKAGKGETVSVVITKPAKTLSDISYSDLSGAFYIAECKCGENGTFSLEVPTARAEKDGSKYNIYINNSVAAMPQETSVAVYDKNTAAKSAESLKNAASAEEIINIVSDGQTREKLGLVNSLYDDADKAELGKRLFEAKDKFGVGNISAIKEVFDECLILQYFENCKSEAEIIAGAERFALETGIENAFLYGFYDSAEESPKLRIVSDMVGKKYESYEELCAELSLSVIRYKLENISGYSEIGGIFGEIYEYIDAKSIYAAYSAEKDKYAFEKYAALHYKRENILKKQDLYNLFSAAAGELGKNAANGSGSSGGSVGSGGGGSKSTGGILGLPAESVLKPQYFSDVDSSMWSSGYINRLYEVNVINGSGDGKFYPYNNITREEFVKLVVAALKTELSETGTDFEDVDKNAWYAGYIAAAYESGIINGVSERRFGIGENITREQAATVIYRIVKEKRIDSETEAKCSDTEDISEYAREAVEFLYGKGIVSGDNGGRFLPKNNLAREEAAKMICTVYDIVWGGNR